MLKKTSPVFETSQDLEELCRYTNVLGKT